MEKVSIQKKEIRNSINKNVKFRILSKEESKGYFFEISSNIFMFISSPFRLMASTCIKNNKKLEWNFVEFKYNNKTLVIPVILGVEKSLIKNIFTDKYIESDLLTASVFSWQYALQLIIESIEDNEVAIKRYEENIDFINNALTNKNVIYHMTEKV